MLCEISVFGPQLWLEVVESQSPETWRQNLWSTVEQQEFPIDRKNAGPKLKWMRVFAVRCPIPIDYEQDHEFDVKAREVWDWCQKRMKQPDFRKIVQAIAGHLKQLPPMTPDSTRPVASE